MAQSIAKIERGARGSQKGRSRSPRLRLPRALSREPCPPADICEVHVTDCEDRDHLAI